MTDKQIERIIIAADVEFETRGNLSWTTARLLLKALKYVIGFN